MKINGYCFIKRMSKLEALTVEHYLCYITSKDEGSVQCFDQVTDLLHLTAVFNFI
jgi:hypothetical protein